MGEMRLDGVLFDKDGTLISFEKTWGPATHAVIEALAGGDRAKMRAQADVLHFSLDDKTFRTTSPLIAGSSATYGSLWGEALGRSDLAVLKGEIDALTAIELLKSLTPIGEPGHTFATLQAMGLRLGLATNDFGSERPPSDRCAGSCPVGRIHRRLRFLGTAPSRSPA